MSQRPGYLGPLPFVREHAPIYVDDRLKAADTLNACKAVTKELLKTLGDLGYRVSAKEAQLSQTVATYLGYILKAGGKVIVKSKERDHPEDLPTQQLSQGEKILRVCWVL